jgi:hypothetical protein
LYVCKHNQQAAIDKEKGPSLIEINTTGSS